MILKYQVLSVELEAYYNGNVIIYNRFYIYSY